MSEFFVELSRGVLPLVLFGVAVVSFMCAVLRPKKKRSYLSDAHLPDKVLTAKEERTRQLVEDFQAHTKMYKRSFEGTEEDWFSRPGDSALEAGKKVGRTIAGVELAFKEAERRKKLRDEARKEIEGYYKVGGKPAGKYVTPAGLAAHQKLQEEIDSLSGVREEKPTAEAVLPSFVPWYAVYGEGEPELPVDVKVSEASLKVFFAELRSFERGVLKLNRQLGKVQVTLNRHARACRRGNKSGKPKALQSTLWCWSCGQSAPVRTRLKEKVSRRRDKKNKPKVPKKGE